MTTIYRVNYHGGRMQTKIYHNPHCSKSRQALELLRARGIEPDIIDYLKTPPSRNEIKHILELLDAAPRAIMRTKESGYLEAGLDDASLSDDQLIDAMIRFPKLIERPIVLANHTAAIGRPPEKVVEIL